MTGSTRITCVGLEPAVARLVDDAARQALGALALEPLLPALEICADDLAGSEDAWLRLRRGTAGEPPGLSIYCHPDVFGPLRPATGTVYPPRAVWESPGPRRATSSR